MFQREAGKQRFALRFPAAGKRKSARVERAAAKAQKQLCPEARRTSERHAPAHLQADVARFVRYKTATLPAVEFIAERPSEEDSKSPSSGLI